MEHMPPTGLYSQNIYIIDCRLWIISLYLGLVRPIFSRSDLRRNEHTAKHSNTGKTIRELCLATALADPKQLIFISPARGILTWFVFHSNSQYIGAHPPPPCYSSTILRLSEELPRQDQGPPQSVVSQIQF